ncbi:hypothetical protein HHK36_014591 [Tetracentron sinense]|uniref:Uncharacterized protein n=1 Tax=Tetracentron sinense TaxID=13715 RepID=A0A835DC32_TETSI|nr:hypothetical protein HHK36_014591 [Tetracentron sinense]
MLEMASTEQGQASASRGLSGSGSSSTPHRLEDSIWFQCSSDGVSASSVSSQSTRRFGGRRPGELSGLKNSSCRRVTESSGMPKFLVQVSPNLSPFPSSPIIQNQGGVEFGSKVLEESESPCEQDLELISISKVGEMVGTVPSSSSELFATASSPGLDFRPEPIVQAPHTARENFGVVTMVSPHCLASLGVDGGSPGLSLSSRGPSFQEKWSCSLMADSEIPYKEGATAQSFMGGPGGGQHLFDQVVVGSSVFVGVGMEEMAAGSELLVASAVAGRVDVPTEVVGSRERLVKSFLILYWNISILVHVALVWLQKHVYKLAMRNAILLLKVMKLSLMLTNGVFVAYEYLSGPLGHGPHSDDLKP